MAIEQLGLSNYEARAYEALLKAESADASAIAERAGVPTGKIYSVLSGLERRSMVEVQNTRPKRFRAVEPKIALERLLEAHKREAESRYNSYCEKAAEIEKKLMKKPSREGNLFWTISLDKGRFSELIASREEYVGRELLLCTGGLEFEDYQQIEQFSCNFAGLLERGVQVRLLLCESDRARIEKIAKSAVGSFKKSQDGGKHAFLHPLLKFFGRGFQIRFSAENSVPFDVIDESEAMLKIRNPANSKEYFAVMAVKDAKLAQELKKKFLGMWGGAEEMKLRL